MKCTDIYWLAGLLDGEGCFSMSGVVPQITLRMTDLDTVTKAKELMSKTLNIHRVKKPKNSNYKDCFTLQVTGRRAIQWMYTIFSLMSLRRRQRIKEIIIDWKSRPVMKGYGKLYLRGVN